MKKNDLIKIIELVVRKEVKKQMTEIFINDKEEIKLSEVISKPKPNIVKKKTKKQYSKNTALNEVLNNTNPLGKSQQDEYPSLGGGVLGSNNMAEVLGYGNLGGVQNKEMAREVAAVDTIKKAGVSVDQVPVGVQDALTRDYSGLMKAINKKKKGEDNFRP
jgi:CRISPR/Cas system Type II protein with McrA/HNH and RuvC-like nuclease domain